MSKIKNFNDVLAIIPLAIITSIGNSILKVIVITDDQILNAIIMSFIFSAAFSLAYAFTKIYANSSTHKVGKVEFKVVNRVIAYVIVITLALGFAALLRWLLNNYTGEEVLNAFLDAIRFIATKFFEAFQFVMQVLFSAIVSILQWILSLFSAE